MSSSHSVTGEPTTGGLLPPALQQRPMAQATLCIPARTPGSPQSVAPSLAPRPKSSGTTPTPPQTLATPSNNFGTTGGGVSKTFTASTDAPYQTAAGITGATDSAGNVQTGRGVPDVAGMVALNPFFVNGISYNFIGTSCVAPLYAGLAAVIRSAIGRDLGPFNDTLYALKDVAFNDVTVGNNSSLDSPANVKLAIPGYTGTTPNAPFFSAGAGWDACTGLGSIDGTKLLNGIASLLYNPNFYFEVNKGSFGLEEAQINAKFDNPVPIQLVLEGFSPNAVTAANIKPTVITSFTQVKITVGAPIPEINSSPDTPQRIFFPCTVDFDSSAVKSLADGGIFPNPGDPPTPTAVPLITSSILIGGKALSAETEIYLEPGADPYFSNYATNGDFALSQDLRVFTVCPGINKSPIDGIPLNASDNTHFDTANGFGYIQAFLTHLNSTYNDPTSTDPFTLLPDQNNAFSADSSVTPTQVDPSNPTGTPFTNYNFAVARVRLSGTPNTSSGANVRVLFRLFVAQTSDTDFQTLTYPSHHDAKASHSRPSSAPATPPFRSSPPATTSPTPTSASTPTTPATALTTSLFRSAPAANWAYYGCYLNVYPTGNTISGKSIQSLLPSTHSCIVAQLVYDQAPIPTGPGIIQGPEYSDNFAQRNLQFTLSDNPGPPSAHICPQTFDARPSLPLGTPGQLLNYPDELHNRLGQHAHRLGRQHLLASRRLLRCPHAREKLYSTNQLSASDANTIQCTVPRGFAFVPIPPVIGANFAGLFTVELSPGRHRRAGVRPSTFVASRRAAAPSTATLATLPTAPPQPRMPKATA